jgi:zinc protease
MHETTRERLALAAVAALLAACAPAATVTPGPAARGGPPPPLAARSIEFPGFHETVLPNGVRLIVVEHRVQPVASVNLYVPSGSAADPAQQAGLAGLTADVLTKGTTTRSAVQVAEAIEGVGGTLSASAGDDWVTVGASVLTEHLPVAFDVLSDVALRPTFPDQEVETARRRTVSGLQAALGQPGEVARRRFIREVYGPEHAYGIAPIPGTVQGLARGDLVRFHGEHFTAENALLVVAGDVRAADVEALARRHFGDWRRGAPPAARFSEPPARDRTTIYLVHRPGSVQSNIWVGHTGVRPGHQDYFALQVLNRVLGGGTDARLFQILREEKGWTYGAYSRFTRPRDVGFFAATAEVRTEVTDSAVAEVMRQLRRLRDDAVPEAEIESARNFLAGSFPLRIETAAQIAAQVAQARLLGLDLDDVTRYPERIRAVSSADVQRVAREHVRPERAAIVVVGDATRVLASLEPLAPVVLYDVEGRPLERGVLEAPPAAAGRFDPAALEPATLTFRLLFQGNPVGTATQRLRREGDVWIANSSIPAVGQETEVRFGAADLVPRTSATSVGQGPAGVRASLRYGDGRIAGRAELPEAMGGARDVDLEAAPGTLLPGMDAWMLAAADLSEGTTLAVPVYDLMSGGIATVTYRVTGVETVTVPAGTFEAYRLEVTGPQPMTVYVRRERPHLPLRQELAAQPVVIELESIGPGT